MTIEPNKFAPPPERVGTVSVDMDGLPIMLRQRGFTPLPGVDLDIVYTRGLPRLLDLFDTYGIKATFFINGRDTDRSPESADLAREAFRKGHEIANHGYEHLPFLTRAPREQVEEEIKRGEEAIERLIGEKPVGFRAPDWNITPLVMEVLEERGYRYDSSVLPTFHRFLFQFLHWKNNNYRRHPTLGSPWTQMLAPLTPYHPGGSPGRLGAKRIIELPLTVSPMLRVPFWGTSFMKFGRKSLDSILSSTKRAGLGYFNFLMHGIDLVAPEEIGDPRLAGKPGAKRALKDKMADWHYLLERMSNEYRLITCVQVVEHSSKRGY